MTLPRPPQLAPRGTARGRTGAGLALCGLVTGAALLATPSASAAVPAFPDNVVVFPDRDFITIEGYQDHVGETATVEVTRDGKVIGSAKGVVEQGDVAFEVNHPGGYCWGAGTGLSVTPDIRGGDVATISFPDGTTGDTTVSGSSARVHAVASGTTLTVTGHLDAAEAASGQVEQRIVNPDLVPLVGKRDVRALPGPLTPAARGGYSSGLDVAANGDFVATYVFATAEAATTAARSGGERLMSWQVEDADANRQGLTIAELGELGGPGMGGCPAGPSGQAAPTSSYALVRSADRGRLAVTWVPASPQPGAGGVTGYSVELVGPASPGGVSPTIGARTPATTTSASFPVDPNTEYAVEVRSLAGPRMSEPFTLAPTTPTPPPLPGDTTVPTVSASPAPAPDPTVAVEAAAVTLTSESGADIYYTTDGSAAITAGLPSDTAVLYVRPVPVLQRTELHWVAFDRAGNFAVDQGTYTPPPAAPPAAPGTPVATPGPGQVALRWTAPVSPATPVTGYQVTVTDAGGVALPTQPPATPTTNQVVTGLAPATTYGFSVVALYGAGPASGSTARTTATTPAAADRVTITKVTYKAGSDFRVTGTSTAPGGTISVYAVDPATAGAQPVLAALTGVPLTPAVAPATGTTYDARSRTTPATKPVSVWVRSSAGGVAGPFPVP